MINEGTELKYPNVKVTVGGSSEDDTITQTTNDMQIIECNKENKKNKSKSNNSKLKKRKLEELNHSSSPCLWFHVHNISKDPTKIRLPKVPSEDIRRKYPVMCLNVINSMDQVLATHFLDQFTHSETIARLSMMSCRYQNKEVEQLNFYGPGIIFRYLYLLNLYYPDRVLRMTKEPSIHTNSTTFQTKIIMELEVSLTCPATSLAVSSTASTSSLSFSSMTVGRFLTKLHEDSVKDHKSSEIFKDLSKLECLFEKFNVSTSVGAMNQSQSQNIHNESTPSSSSSSSFLLSSPVSPIALGKPTRFVSRLIIIINNIYEKDQIDEVLFQMYHAE